MALLIPAFLDDNTPPGEREVFNLLAAAPENWTVFHSLDLSPWNRGRRTELDFLVIIPEVGMLCIEVKSHREISFEEGRWAPPEIRRSPIKQVVDARYTFHRRLCELAPHFQSVPVSHLCIFSKAAFDLPPNLSVQPWELMDGRQFQRFENGTAFAEELGRRVRQGISADQNLRALNQPLSKWQVESISNFCVPVQKLRPSKRDEIKQREIEIERLLLEQQKPVLQLARLNRQIIVSGGAGTGKTLIAMEIARRATESGDRVGLICFNQLVGDWMKNQFTTNGNLPPNLIVGRALQTMMQMVGVKIPSTPPSSFWDSELYTALEEGLTDPELGVAEAFDFLVIDEAQDLMSRPRLWDCISQLLKGGFDRGSFALFGDFDNQVFSAPEAMAQTLRRVRSSSRSVNYHLSENCRNYRIIGLTAIGLAGLNTDIYTGFMRQGGSIQNFDIDYYDTERAQVDMLGALLREFKAKGFKPSEVTILSLCPPAESAAEKLRHEGFRIREARDGGYDTSFASINSFKGMENKIVVLTDLEFGDKKTQRNLLYTGITRATESVRLLCPTASKATLLRWLSERTNE